MGAPMQTWVALERDEDQSDLGGLLLDWFEFEAKEYRNLLKTHHILGAGGANAARSSRLCTGPSGFLQTIPHLTCSTFIVMLLRKEWERSCRSSWMYLSTHSVHK